MGQRDRDAREREEFRKTQERKKRQLEARKRRAAGEYPGSAKSEYGNAKKSSGKKRNSANGNKKNKQRDNAISRKAGLVICAAQAITSILFMAALFILNMLPAMYLGVIGAVLFIFLGITLATQLLSKKKGLSGKIFGVIMSIVLLAGSYYVFKTNGMIGKISGGDYKLDKVVVAVLADDPAEKIKDASAYNFGVQYAMKGDEVRETVSEIGEEVGNDIKTTEFASLGEQAQALHDGTVDAIIYNEGYTGILEEVFENYSQNVKIIYSHSIKSKVENKAADVKVKSDAFSIYISGIDVYGAIETNSRSDVNIIAVVNPTTHQVLLITTPRDYYVEFPGITGGQKDKLTHAGIYGVDTSMATLGQLYDMNIDFYARVNFTSLVQIVDALGGVDVNSEYAFTTSYDSGYEMDVVAGTNHFNGEQALAFSRERQNIPDGDNQRGKNQQAVITAMIRKMISPAMLTGANGIMNSVSGNVETNMSQDQIQDLIKDQLAKGGSWNIKSMAATGTGDEQFCYSYAGSPLYVTQPDINSVAEIEAAVNAVQNGEILPDSEVAE